MDTKPTSSRILKVVLAAACISLYALGANHIKVEGNKSNWYWEFEASTVPRNGAGEQQQENQPHKQPSKAAQKGKAIRKRKQ